MPVKINLLYKNSNEQLWSSFKCRVQKYPQNDLTAFLGIPVDSKPSCGPIIYKSATLDLSRKHEQCS